MYIYIYDCVILLLSDPIYENPIAFKHLIMQVGSSNRTSINIDIQIHINTKPEASSLRLEAWKAYNLNLAAWSFRSLELQMLGAWSLRRWDLKLEELAACSFNLEARSLRSKHLKLEAVRFEAWRTCSFNLEARSLRLEAWGLRFEVGKLAAWGLRLAVLSSKLEIRSLKLEALSFKLQAWHIAHIMNININIIIDTNIRNLISFKLEAKPWSS